MNRILLASTIIALASGRLFAATYFVATNGNDAVVGSLEAPLATLNAANKCVKPGDTVFIRGGKYLLTAKQTIGVELSQSGEAGKPIRFLA